MLFGRGDVLVVYYGVVVFGDFFGCGGVFVVCGVDVFDWYVV